MAGGEPIPENPLLIDGAEILAASTSTYNQSKEAPTADNDLAVCTQKPNHTTIVALQVDIPAEKGEQSEATTPIAIPQEEQAILALFWSQVEEQMESIVEETKPEESTSTGTGIVAATATMDSTQTEAAAGQEEAPATVLAFDADQPAAETTEPTVVEPVVTAPPPPPPVVEPEPVPEDTPILPEGHFGPHALPADTHILEEGHFGPVSLSDSDKWNTVFRKTCATCNDSHEWRKTCSAMYCLACGTQFATIWNVYKLNEDVRATIEEKERPACSPGDCEEAYCADCLLDWFDNCLAFPQRERPPETEGVSMVPILEGFASEGYMQRVKAVQEYWDDQDKVFCPVPSCSAYVARSSYTLKREVEVIEKVLVEKKVEEDKEKAVEEKKEEEVVVAAPLDAEAEAVEYVETIKTAMDALNVEERPETPEEAELNQAEAILAMAAAAITTEEEERIAKEAAEAAAKAAEPVYEEVKKMVMKDLKSCYAVCPEESCRTPICTQCKSHFHGFDVPCPSRTSFFKSFMLSRFTKEKKVKKEVVEGQEAEEAAQESDEESDDGYNSDEDEYEDYPNRFRQCTSCQNLVAKNTGCDHMTCACGYAFCFSCGGEYGNYHDCIDEDDYFEGRGVGGIKVTNEDGYLDEGAEIRVQGLDMLPKEEEEKKALEIFEKVEFEAETEGGEKKTVWKVKAGVELAKEMKMEFAPFTEEDKTRMGRSDRPRGVRGLVVDLEAERIEQERLAEIERQREAEEEAKREAERAARALFFASQPAEEWEPPFPLADENDDKPAKEKEATTAPDAAVTEEEQPAAAEPSTQEQSTTTTTTTEEPITSTPAPVEATPVTPEPAPEQTPVVAITFTPPSEPTSPATAFQVQPIAIQT